MNALHAFILGDLLHDIQHSLRPYELQAGAMDRAITAAVDSIALHFERDRGFEPSDVRPVALPGIESPPDISSPIPTRNGKIWTHLRGDSLEPVQRTAVAEVEVDWLRVRPVVKVIGEFWAQMTESDGNFRKLEFLEREGAEVSVEPISPWLLYLLHRGRTRLRRLRRSVICRSHGGVHPP